MTRLDQVVRVVRDGQTKRAPIERLADHLTGYFVPVVTLLAILTWVIWLGLGLGGALPSDYLDKPTGGWRKYILVFISCMLLTIACADRYSRMVARIRHRSLRRRLPLWHR